MTIYPPSHSHRRPLLPTTTPPYPLTPSPNDATVTLRSLSFSCHPHRRPPFSLLLLTTPPTPPLPSPPSKAIALPSQSYSRCRHTLFLARSSRKRCDSFASEKSKVTLLLNFLFS
ncbi:hypothetical protein TIFTF001_015537 [Ficus carica]|uniref:Uncharacterized protein n=1 Tax=Ficus carica TaxID=3494 RepID=A0AA88D917_FICCA|nr:hypothetical protein TIFTF001_015537 [Ficus carica]